MCACVCVCMCVHMCMCACVGVYCVCVFVCMFACGRHLVTLTTAAQTINQWWLMALGFEPDPLGFESGLYTSQHSLHCLVWGSREEKLQGVAGCVWPGPAGLCPRGLSGGALCLEAAPPPIPLLASLAVAFVQGLGITLGVAQCKISQSMSELQT